ncbi:hypothetical protein MSC49_07230 [Methylosinus sp. C49]|uniref:hypothetical protein n=1 Tax=Methylosinus sp. C49 TaxID=2699395 RepID=UPI0013672785|nr:hypothetical protein [Methylosinus sp. C49]BBU60788.1 hypothetical protein MSC49_07230 [Methylosinus sp. C49]
MTKLLDEAVAAARTLPAAMQDDLARVIMALTGGEPGLIRLTAEEEASFDESFAEAERDEFATEEQIRAIWAKHGL